MADHPVLPIRDIVIFPGVIAPIFVGRPSSLKSVEEATLHDKELFVVTQKDNLKEEPEEGDLFSVGTLCRVIQMVRIPDGSTKILVEGLSRGSADEYFKTGEYIVADVTVLSYTGKTSKRIEPLRRAVLEQFEKYVNLHPKLPVELLFSIANIDDVSLFADIVASHTLVKTEDKQELLEQVAPEPRLEAILKILIRETELLEAEHSIHDRVRKEIDRNNKEIYLREQIKAIQAELGQGDMSSDLEELDERIKKARMPKEVSKKAYIELDRLSKMQHYSAEATVARTYIEWLADLPWKKKTKDLLELKTARETLDEDHYGLDEVKERIIEFLAVQKLGSDVNRRGHVLCFVGPPGVGKTSLGRSIARAMNRKFVNFSLGGMHDEAEIRGHRRTYIGSLPGRIIQKIKQAGVNNPVMLMDEIDKIGKDFRGDPASALLEVLDPEQNSSFTDHFIEVPFDLSSVMFITTANNAYKIPKPLLDRMEIISIPGYVVEEKLNIAKRHLWPNIVNEHGIGGKISVKISDNVMKTIITDYTREAGVRNLDRKLSKIARKVATKIVTEQEESGRTKTKFSISRADLHDYLGAPKIHDTVLPNKSGVGAALGLAWTEAGGDVLIIESAMMKGSGRINCTGNLGDIMVESADIALAYLRSNASKYKLTNITWDKTDIHVHVPEGAIPKDGPSAGVTLALSLLSVLANKPIRSDIAMTGEMTLRGKVLAIGGVREKILAAKRNGIYSVILPKDNAVDVEELAEWAKAEMQFHYVTNVTEVFKLALISEGRR